MQVVAALVDRQMILFPVDHKGRARDSVGVRANHRAKTCRILQIMLHIVKSQHNVLHDAIPVRCLQTHQQRTQI